MKLGHRFRDYVRNILETEIRRQLQNRFHFVGIDDLADSRDKSHFKMVFHHENFYTEILEVICFNKQILVYAAIVNDNGRCIDYTFSDGYLISKDKTNLCNELREAVKKEKSLY